MDYNRLVRDLNGLSPEAFFAGVSEAFEVVPVVGLFAGKPWDLRSPGRSLASPGHRSMSLPLADPVARLMSVSSDHLLGSDPRHRRSADATSASTS